MAGHRSNPTGEHGARLLVFSLAGRDYGLAAMRVAGVVESRAVRPVPGAPTTVVGLADWRGRLLTVVDLPRLMGCPGQGGSDCLVRLSPPLDRTALRVPAAIAIHRVEAAGLPPAIRGDRPVMIRLHGRDVELLDPAELVRRAEDRGSG